MGVSNTGSTMKKSPPKNQFKKIVIVLFINALILSYIGMQTDDERYQAGVEAYKEENFSKTYNIMSSLSGKENPAAEYFLATLYANGQGVDVNEEQAIFWYKKSATHGNKNAQALLKSKGIVID